MAQSIDKQGSGQRTFIHLLVAAGIAIVVYTVFSGSLDNQLTNWDDPGYINDNTLIKDLSWQGMKKIWSTQVMANYHPLTILTYAIDYSHSQLDPWLYHFQSLAWHLLATVLVYWFTWLLTGRITAAAITALLFGIHPMHVESVAWASGRKDVVYGTFYMAASIAYIYYKRATHQKWIWYGATLFLFLCALLGKPLAVTLPVIMLLADYFERRPLTSRSIIEKIPFFILSLTFGIVAYMVQRHAGAMVIKSAHFTAIERIALGWFAWCTYLWKAVAPIQLCCFYPYPQPINGALPTVYYLFPLLAAGLLFVLWRFGRRHRVIVFGSLFFMANIMLLLQFLGVGEAIVADRYSYIAYLGLFFMAGWYISGWLQPGTKLQWRAIAATATLACLSIFGYASARRSLDWYDAASIWRADIEHEPVLAPDAYNNLGFIYYNRWSAATNAADKKLDYDSALYLLNRAVEIRPTFLNPYVSLGEMERTMGMYDEAKRNYYTALHIKSTEPNLYLGLGILYLVTKNYDSAGYCFRTALIYNPVAEAHGNYANFLSLTGKNDEALVEYGIAIKMNPEMYSLYLNRGKVYKQLSRWDDAVKDLDMAIRLNPDLGELYYERSFCYQQQGNKQLALQDVEKAIALHYQKVDNSYYETLRKQQIN